MSYTKGPWKYCPGEFNSDGKVGDKAGSIEADEYFIAELWADVDELRAAAPANGALIAAAPELLEALKAWIEHRSKIFHAQMMGTLDKIPTDSINKIVNQAEAAIAKAEGKL